MYRVLIADDEAASLQYMRTIVETYAEGFSVIAQAENGGDALALLEKTKPDLLMADIRMPGMNGVELAKRARALYPGLIIVIVSGYSEFEYARGALEAGAEDYLLKPLSVSKATELLHKLRVRLDGEYEQKRRAALSDLLSGRELDGEALTRLFDCERFSLAVARVGNLPSRLELPALGEPASLALPDNARMWLLPSRDAQEWLALSPGDEDEKMRLELLQRACEAASGGLSVTIVDGGSFSPSALREGATALLHTLDERLVVGRDQVINGTLPPGPKPRAFSDSALPRLRYCLSAGDYPQLKELLFQWAVEWERQRLPQREVESALLQIVECAAAALPALRQRRQALRAEALEACQLARSLGEIMLGVWDVLFGGAARGEGEAQNREETLQTICSYIREHCAEPISVQSVCSVFGVSPTYLSRLFRGGSDTTFGKYLTDCRITLAKSLMDGDDSIKLKDVAQCAGYEDQSYFTKVFQKQTGMTPTQYMERASGR